MGLKRAVVLAVGLVVISCAPAHLRAIGLSGSGRSLPELFLGGWDGRRLHLYTDGFVIPGQTTRPQLVDVLGNLSSDLYAVVYVQSAKLDPVAAKAHGIFCDTPWCMVVLDRKGGGSFAQWGSALAVFELAGPGDGPIRNVWLAGSEVRPPGPTTWDHKCLTKKDTPRYVHPDGGALYPAKVSSTGVAFALFGPRDLAGRYENDGFDAPSDTLCDETLVRLSKERFPPPPKVSLGQELLAPAPAKPKTK